MIGFERLEIWQRSVKFAERLNEVSRGFPSDERFGLTNQLQRAAVSISANLAEGNGRGTNPDFVRFIGIGSLMEVVSHISMAKEQDFINESDYQLLYEDAQALSRMMSGLKKISKKSKK